MENSAFTANILVISYPLIWFSWCARSTWGGCESLPDPACHSGNRSQWATAVVQTDNKQHRWITFTIYGSVLANLRFPEKGFNHKQLQWEIQFSAARGGFSSTPSFTSKLFLFSPSRIHPSFRCSCHCYSDLNPRWSESHEIPSGFLTELPRRRKLQVGVHQTTYSHVYFKCMQRNRKTHTATCDGVENLFGKGGIYWVAVTGDRGHSPPHTEVISGALNYQGQHNGWLAFSHKC